MANSTLLYEQCSRVHFEDSDDSDSVNEGSLNGKAHSMFLKSSSETIDTIDSHFSEKSLQLVEESIMNWFGQKGINNGNPEEVIEKARQEQRKNTRMELIAGNFKMNSAASLIERRKNKSLKLSV